VEDYAPERVVDYLTSRS